MSIQSLTTKIKLLICLLTISFGQLAIAAETPSTKDGFILIVNAQSNQQIISKKELRSLFSLRRSVWDDGTEVRLVTLPDDHPLHKKFIEEELKLFPYQVKRIWNRQIFSGSAVRPLTAKSIPELIKLVAKTKGAIGYTPESGIKAIENEQVKIITIN